MSRATTETQVVFLCIDKYQSDGIPFFLAEVFGKPVIQIWIERARNLFPECKLHFAVESNSHLQVLKAILNKLNLIDDYSIHLLPRHICGSAATALFVVSQLPPETDLFIVSTNELINFDFLELRERFRCSNSGAGILLFKSFQPKYSYVQFDDDSIVGLYQYKVVSEFATTGLFYFSSCAKFVKCASKMILKGESVDGKFYIAPTLNELILDGDVIQYQFIDSHDYMPLKSDKDILFALSSAKKDNDLDLL